MTNPLLDNTNCDWSELEGINRVIIPFIACGDLSGFDADTSYSLEVSNGTPIPILSPILCFA